MSQPSTLRQVLAIFENATTPLSLPQIARELGISTEALDGIQRALEGAGGEDLAR